VVASRRQGVAGELVGTIGGHRTTRAEAGLTQGGGRLRGGVAACGGVLTGGRVGGDSG
jgi:hypothetical protein